MIVDHSADRSQVDGTVKEVNRSAMNALQQ